MPESKDLELPHATAQALIWRLAAELARRYPDRLWVHPEGGEMTGIYDNVSVLDVSEGARLVTTFNARGSAQALGSEVRRWTDAYAADADRASWLEEVARVGGLPPRHGRLPRSSPATLVARYVATFLALQVGSRDDWFATSPARHDDGGLSIAGMAEWQRSHPEAAPYVVCLAMNGDEAALALSIHGDVWRSDGAHVNLSDLHVGGRPVTELVLRTASDLVP